MILLNIDLLLKELFQIIFKRLKNNDKINKLFQEIVNVQILIKDKIEFFKIFKNGLIMNLIDIKYSVILKCLNYFKG